MSVSRDHVDLVVAEDGSLPAVSRADVERLGARPGEHLRLVRSDSPAPGGPRRVRGLLVGKLGADDMITDDDFAAAKAERTGAARRRYGTTE